MKANALKKKIADGVNCVGGWAAIPDPFACEVYAAQGWDSVTIDMQHGGSNINDAVPLLAAIQSAGDATQLIRVPWNFSDFNAPVFGYLPIGPTDHDLTRQHPGGEPQGQRITVSGRVQDEDGRPIPHALAEA